MGQAFDREGNVLVGATGRFPYGKCDASDEGELQMALAADHNSGIVRLLFGKPIVWIGLSVTEARALAAALLEKANELERRKA